MWITPRDDGSAMLWETTIYFGPTGRGIISSWSYESDRSEASFRWRRAGYLKVEVRVEANPAWERIEYNFILVPQAYTRSAVCIIQQNAKEGLDDLHGPHFWCAGEPLKYGGPAPLHPSLG